MKYLILVLSTLSVTAFAQTTTECSSGQYFDASLNRCVLSTGTVDTKTEANNCGGLTGEAQTECYKKVVTDEVTSLENTGQIEEEKKSKGKYTIPALMTIGSGYLLWKQSAFLTKCGEVSVGLMLGAATTTLLGEIITQSKYKSKLKKMKKEYEETISQKDTDTNNDLERINSNQTSAFNFQIDQEKARETAHKSRRNVYALSSALYTAASVAAIIESLRTFGGVGYVPCKLFGSTYNKNNNQNIAIAQLSLPSLFSNYGYLQDVSKQEMSEIILRKLYNSILPTAHASDIGAAAGLLGTIAVATKVFNAPIASALVHPIGRAALSTTLAGYSVITSKKASDHAKEAKDRAKAIEEIRDGFLANGGAGLTNCTEADRSLPSKPTCYCYESSGTRRADRANSPTCQAVFGVTGSALPGATDFGATGVSAASFSTSGCLTTAGVLDEQCQCQKTNTCSTISGNLNLGSLGNISGLTQAVSDASNFTNGNIGSADLDSASLERSIANISAASDKFEANPKVQDAAKKADEIGVKLQRSFGNSVQNALNNPDSAAAISSLLGSGLNASDASDTVASNKPVDFKAGEKTEAAASAPLLKSGSKGSVSIDDFDFGAKNNTGGIKVEDGAKDLAEGKFQIDDISDKTDANIFSIISNRYHTTGLKKLFEDSDEK